MTDNTTPSSAEESAPAAQRSGTVALIGRSNVGKSTLLNAALRLPLAVVTRKPQTTRDKLLGFVHHAQAEIGLLDTPGLHRASSRLGKEMNRASRGAARDADVVAFVVTVPRKAPRQLNIHKGDLELLGQIDSATPVILVINKVDLLKDKAMLLPLMEAYSKERDFSAIVPISALRDDGVTLLLDEVAKLLPVGEWQREDDDVTNRPMRYFASEYVREQILDATSQEVPHSVAVTIDTFTNATEKRAARIEVTIHVERDGQKRIVIGDKGAVLKRVGERSRHRIEALMGCKVFLKLFVRVTPNWRERIDQLTDFGFMAGSTSGGDGS